MPLSCRQSTRELGVTFELNSNVTAVKIDSVAQRFPSITIAQVDGSSSRTVSAKAIVLAAGPWTSRIFSRLFPNAKIKIPMDSTGAAGNHFRVRTPGWTPADDSKGSEQVFFNTVMPNGGNLDITSFPGGQLYIGGWGAIPEEVPRLATDVKPQASEIEPMMRWAEQFLRLEGGGLDAVGAGRCYRPLATPNHPIITKVNWDLLGTAVDTDTTHATSESNHNCSNIVGGLYLNTAHFGDGMTLSAGSGKVASELILGEKTSVDISGLGLPIS